MFQVGKKYKSLYGEQVVVCIGVTSKGLPVFEWPSGNYGGVSESALGCWIEYKEPIKHVRYFNVYPSDVGVDHKSRDAANKEMRADRIACVRVEFTEGQYDE